MGSMGYDDIGVIAEKKIQRSGRGAVTPTKMDHGPVAPDHLPLLTFASFRPCLTKSHRSRVTWLPWDDCAGESGLYLSM